MNNWVGQDYVLISSKQLVDALESIMITNKISILALFLPPLSPKKQQLWVFVNMENPCLKYYIKMPVLARGKSGVDRVQDHAWTM